MMKFVVFKDLGGDWRWKLVATNGQIIATSGEGYRDRSHAINMVQRIKYTMRDNDVPCITEGPGPEQRGIDTKATMAADAPQAAVAARSGLVAKDEDPANAAPQPAVLSIISGFGDDLGVVRKLWARHGVVEVEDADGTMRVHSLEADQVEQLKGPAQQVGVWDEGDPPEGTVANRVALGNAVRAIEQAADADFEIDDAEELRERMELDKDDGTSSAGQP